jgi:hypothetical protein
MIPNTAQFHFRESWLIGMVVKWKLSKMPTDYLLLSRLGMIVK